MPYLNQTDDAISAGAVREEVIDAAAIKIELMGGHSFVVVRNNLSDFLDDIEKGN